MKTAFMTMLFALVSLAVLLDFPFAKWVVGAFTCALGLYVCARLVTAAYFQSKRQYDEGSEP